MAVITPRIGVTVDQHLSWKSNTENICKKITSGISGLRRLKDFVDRQEQKKYNFL
jgi:hypothetical protein